MSGVTLKIHIENPRRYTTGDLVTGVVELQAEKNVDLESVEVELLGVSTSQNYAQAHDTFSVSSEKHNLIKEVRRVFPAPDSQESLSAKKFTLAEGTHLYPFEFAFPGKDYIAQCVRDKKKLHRKYYLKKEKQDSSSLAGTFLYQDSTEVFCQVAYSINATAAVPSKFGNDITASETIVFEPKNSEMFFSLQHISDLSSLLPKRDYTCSRIKYESDGMAEAKSRISKLFSSNSLNLPFELMVRFKDVLSLSTERGVTNRVIEGGHMLSKFVDLQILTPLSVAQLSQALGIRSDQRSSLPALRISRIRVKLVSVMRFAAMSESISKSKEEILDRELDLEIPLSEFERKEYRGQELFRKLPSKVPDNINKYYCQRLRLDPSWWDCLVKDVGQSFMTCNVRKDVNLVVYVTLASSHDPAKTVEIKSVSPVIFLRQEHSDFDAPASIQDQLPIYTPRPPSYISAEDAANGLSMRTHEAAVEPEKS